jgi:hypothetical protein
MNELFGMMSFFEPKLPRGSSSLKEAVWVKFKL